MKIESCPCCGIVYDAERIYPTHTTICVDEVKQYYITYNRMTCPNCEHHIVNERVYT